ncbi:MAG TPA: type IV toxin-antitoxin system AbiEi family antitoxin [Chlamydiales bacterium]|nr:type IV toxin-antitoxin system AbiEi family antitoxin [Chlamydiales bacterium]
MKGQFLISSHTAPLESNIYADKSALVLDWLLRVAIGKTEFSLREVAKETGVSIGLVQKVLGALAFKGILQTEGVRTAKKFSFKKPRLLLNNWLEHYSIVKKCKMKTYRSAFQGKGELLEALKKANLNQKVALALHSAAEAHGCKNTNLSTLELYVWDSAVRLKLEEALKLEPQERGYEVLLIEPYYKSLLNLGSAKDMKMSSALLTFLDLYHFPLRGREQAEFMAQRIAELKRIYKSG